MPTIPQKELRNNIGEAQLGRVAPQQWVSGARLRAIWAAPAPATLAQDLGRFAGDLADPFS